MCEIFVVFDSHFIRLGDNLHNEHVLYDTECLLIVTPLMALSNVQFMQTKGSKLSYR